ncbi:MULTISPECIES: signal recognition particle-docking protein FtsY [Mycolicibacterium]|uniref:Signal recognition particle receptor FtsY n=1 Tax=Mycolicibacterium vanbaalenii (strain DSM 7251 / JCM 13017 / BCRC 16820 / KCTC 9966 / NRRL B-24157 / PYR-1) TaxID=350058 RepID=A1T742_MYCVP|nr:MULTISPECIES: signal recognition particle-docking protein FtsY [Mycolicibacterium]ABM12992.1 signal recognition particle-docking protein FtsY [Mycolicibacterium vanbaalenii PYR-1]MCV7125991.1 signal recognition particle-docking protein FtsY [Mycolicibacterium vanbaalenii PYR-1]QZY48228.1 signal recognition particle-docking protein FtsY [Mycolicibacterium austroafricanum]UJL26738.1 signal recognition particle-docking protein FtsY [Mycolicibacterium vanbaalenii]WND58849.1 signal recognition p
MSEGLWIAIAVIAVLLLVALVVGLVRYRRRRISLSAPDTATPVDRSGGYTATSGITFAQSTPVQAPPRAPERIDTTGLPAVGDDATIPRDAPKRPIADVRLPEPPVLPPEPVVVPEPVTEAPEPAVAEVGEAPEPPGPQIEEIAPTEGRLDRLRGRLSKSQSTLGRSMLGLLGGGDLDEDSWEEIEDTLLIADLGPVVTESVVTSLRAKMAASQVRTEADARAVLREVLIAELRPDLDRSIKALPHADKPSVLLVVGVNGTGKTTTVGKLARVLVADGRRVVLGAADTFRAAAADQLQSWASRVGAQVVRGPEGADPASVAFDAVDTGIAAGADVVVIDTAGRLHTKTGLMDELGKVKRVVGKRAAVDEVLLVLDATIGQNSLPQARVFAEVVDITGVVLTKLDGTAKGGIVFRVQQELGVPVKLVGLGEGPDDLAPFEPAAFVDALLG